MRVPPGIVLAAPASGSGKTLITAALCRIARDRGMRVAPFKAGPDFIDPEFLAAAAGAAVANLDLWAMRQATIAGLLARANGADLCICEGAMGLFDGAPDAENRAQGTVADLAVATGWPVVLLVDVRGQGASAAATVRGFATHRPDLQLAGVIFNRVASLRHEAMLRAAMLAALPGLLVLGAIRRDAAFELPSRHLGLVQAIEQPSLDPFLARAARLVAGSLDCEGLFALARPGHMTGLADPAGIGPLGQRIALARDAAFAFAYPWQLESWRAAGAQILPFSPLADEAPDRHADAVYLPGGYPELHAGKLAGNARFLDGLRAAERHGATIYGECGGYMVLGARLVDASGGGHAMAHLLPLVTRMGQTPRLGYRRLTLAEAGPLGPAGARFRGHEFHYAEALEESVNPLFQAEDSRGMGIGPSGLRRGRVIGSFMHLIDSEE
jgi:cobyrinic acid a,c-diamide synthase